jgi:hypothetical protein
MRTRVCLALLAVMGLGTPAPLPASTDSDLQAGIRQFKEGDLQAAVISLDRTVERLRPEAASRRDELVEAFVYKGAALVGLAQEEPAKAAFREALRLDPQRRLSEDTFSRRVVRVFEAAREGKTESVLMPPSTAAKKAGIGALGIGAIVGGVALAGGGVAVAAGGSDSTPTAPPPTVTPSSYTVTLEASRNCGAGGFDLSGGGTLSLAVAIVPALRCLEGFCLSAPGSIYHANCQNTQETVWHGDTLTITGLTAGRHPLWFCDCEVEPQKRVPMTVTVTATLR